MKTRQRSCSITLITCPDRRSAQRIASALVEARLAACVNLVPGLTSIFRWEGRLQKAGEVLLIAKSSTRCFPALVKAVRRLHPYTVPEIIRLPITAGFPGYLKWLKKESK